MAIWPFSKVFGAGLVNNDVPTHTQMNQLDENAAQAADGSIWSDSIVARNWVYDWDVGAASIAQRYTYRAASGEWFCAGVTSPAGGDPVVANRQPPYRVSNLRTVPVGAGFVGIAVFGSNPAGVMLLGGTPSAGTVQKLRRSLDGVTWTIQDYTSATGPGTRSLAWFAAAGLWVLGYGSSGAAAVETSADGITWNVRTAPNTHARGAMAQSPTLLVVIADGATSTSKIITSGDGITWTERDVGVTKSWADIAYHPLLQKFVLLANDGSIRTSSDGITWVAGTALPTTGELLAVSWRVLVAFNDTGGVYGSIDGAVTWRLLARLDGAAGGTFTPNEVLVGPGGQILVADSLTAEGRATLIAGGW